MRQGILLICFSFILYSLLYDGCDFEKSSMHYELDSLSGVYSSPFNKQGVCYGSIEIKRKSGRTFYFDIETAHIDGCIGKLNGEFILDSNLVGVYQTRNGANIRFEFHNYSLRIVEQEDCQEHGMRCWFDGMYILNIE